MFRVFQACDLLYLHKPFPSEEFQECACGKCTGLPVSRCCRLAFVVTPSFRISDSTPSMHLEKSRKTSCRENVSSRPWLARSHVLPIPLVCLEMLSGSQKRATLCTSFVSVIIVSHCFTGCSCTTMLCGVVNKCQFLCIARIKFGHNLEAIPFFVDGSGSGNVVDLCHGVNLWENVSPLKAISHVFSFHWWI